MKGVTNYLQTIDYRYNNQGNLTHIRFFTQKPKGTQSTQRMSMTEI